MLTSESYAERQARLATGAITEEEIRAYWANPHELLFEHTLTRIYGGKQASTTFRVWALTEHFTNSLFAALKNSWAWEGDFESLRSSVEAFHRQRSIPQAVALNVEYYIATDRNNNPYAITGIYTRDMEGQGFALCDALNPKIHYLNAGLGWFAVSSEMQRAGIGGFLHDWIQRMATARGVKRMVIETDNSEGERSAVALYESRGYKLGFNVPGYFGPGRDRYTYWAYFPLKAQEQWVAGSTTRMTGAHVDEVKSLARAVYSPARFKEFAAALDLLLFQKQAEAVMQAPDAFIYLAPDHNIRGFVILAKALYANAVTNYWQCSRKGDDLASGALMRSVREYAGRLGREVVILHREGEDKELSKYGFRGSERGIPYVYQRGDKTRFLFYSKVLRP